MEQFEQILEFDSDDAMQKHGTPLSRKLIHKQMILRLS